MYLFIGIFAVFGSILLGFTMGHGKVAALIQPNEFIILGGAGLGSLLAATSMKTVKDIFKDIIGILKPDPCGKESYIQLLQLLYEISNLMRRDGLLTLEAHVEHPEDSEVLKKYPLITKNHHFLSFFTDSLRLIVMGGVGSFELQEMMEADIEIHAEEAKKNASEVQTVGDAMPGFGICAAVLGIVNTMEAIDGPPAEIGEKVGAALVGTFLGILLAYGVFGPLAKAMESRAESAVKLIKCMKCGVLSMAQGLPPILVAEFTRRNIEPDVRPSFQTMESMVKGHFNQAPQELKEAA